MNLEIVIATNNQHKTEEFRKIFKGQSIVFYSLRDLNLKIDINENGATYEENAKIKAETVAKYVKFPVLADDSGIEIESMNNEPGIFSARFAESHGGNVKTNEYIIEKLKNETNRKAIFKCSLAFCVNGKTYIFNANCPGRILEKAVGENGFGYDPIFFSDEANMPFGEADEEIKNKFSHRAKACLKLLTFLKINDFKF